MAINKHNMDMCSGPLAGKMIRYAIPLVLTYVLQLTFLSADLMIIGNYSANSMAAIGTTMDLNNLLLNMLLGISVGTNVLAAQYYGARDSKNVSRVLHTATAFAIVGGIVFAIIGNIICIPVLTAMKVPPELLPKSALYMRLMFFGIPCSMLYNYGCSVLRAVGDTRRPLYYLVAAGIINVLLNLLFVSLFHWDVAGVAVATLISQALSAFLVLRALINSRGSSRLILKNIRFELTTLKKILYVGVPAGLQGMFFSLSNVIIQSAINTFGAAAIAGMTATSCLEWVLYAAVHACMQTAVAFTGQNYGGKKYSRVVRSTLIALIMASAVPLIMGISMYIAGEPLIALFNSDPEVVYWGMKRIAISFILYFLCGWMDVCGGALRGMGFSILPTAIVLIFVCFFRIGWILSVFQHFRSIETLIWAYPISWFMAALLQGAALFIVFRKMLKKGGISYEVLHLH